MNNKQKLAVIIIDGLGETSETKNNPYYLANTPNLDMFKKKFPNILINASEEAVGLPKGQPGNSETGHLTIGAGRIIKQPLLEINEELFSKKFLKNLAFNKLVNNLKKQNNALHLFGLVSNGNVHASFNQLEQLIKYLQDKKINFFLHIITDGRDSYIKESPNFIKKLMKKNVKIASISGRYYAMDRNLKWERTQKFYDCIVKKNGNNFLNPLDYVNSEYKNGITDEFIIPAYSNEFDWKINQNDNILIFNYRSDRIRQIIHLLSKTNFEKTKYSYLSPNYLLPQNIYTFKEVPGINTNVIFETKKNFISLGDVLEQNNFSQIRAAETEKYPHVTFFLDGEKMIDRKNELKILVPSPNVATYDLKPEMSAELLTNEVLKKVDDYDFLIMNYANPDMVGHSGLLEPTIKAIECVDKMLEKLYNYLYVDKKINFMILSDHGNAECIIDKNNQTFTSHTTNPVRLYIISDNIKFKEKYQKKIKGNLSNIAPTILSLLNIKKPKEMSGKSLIKNKGK